MRALWRRRPLIALAVLSLPLIAGGELLVQLGIDAMPVPGAQQGQVVDDAINFLLRAVVPVFVLVTLALVFALTRFRARPGDGDSPDQRRSSRAVTLTWLAVTSALAILVTIHPGITGLRALGDDRGRVAVAGAAVPDLRIDVTAQQWGWTFAYPQYGVRYAQELALPVNRRVRFTLRSRDVVHSFWVPSFRIKKDVIPGEVRTMYVTPDRLTSTSLDPRARVQCAELCGIGHANMQAIVRVLRGAAFESWARRARTLPPPM